MGRIWTCRNECLGQGHSQGGKVQRLESVGILGDHPRQTGAWGFRKGNAKWGSCGGKGQIHRLSHCNWRPGLPSVDPMTHWPTDGFLFIFLPCDFTIVFTASVFSTDLHYPPEFKTAARNRGDRQLLKGLLSVTVWLSIERKPTPRRPGWLFSLFPGLPLLPSSSLLSKDLQPPQWKPKESFASSLSNRACCSRAITFITLAASSQQRASADGSSSQQLFIASCTKSDGGCQSSALGHQTHLVG